MGLSTVSADKRFDSEVSSCSGNRREQYANLQISCAPWVLVSVQTMLAVRKGSRNTFVSDEGLF